MPRPKKETEDGNTSSNQKEDASRFLKYAMTKSRSYQKSQKRYVEKLIPIQPIQILVKEENGVRYEFVPCEKIQVEI